MEIYRIHPVLVHFPIALLLTAFVLYAIGHLRRRENFLQAGRWNLCMGAACALLAALAGLVAEEFVPHAAEGAHRTLQFHKYFGLSVALYFTLFTLVFWRKLAELRFTGKDLFFALFSLGVAALVAAAYLGGELVYTYGTGVSSSVLENSPAEHHH